MSLKILNVFILVFTITSADEYDWLDSTDTLIATHVVFRHGARTPDKYCFKALNITKDYMPIGIGQLTQKGKMDEYLIGLALRERYQNFLGDNYYPNLIEARSTDYDRTKASLLLCLAGLFPPSEEEIWMSNIPWQPIPFNYKEPANDMLRYPTKCSKFKQRYQELLESPNIKTILDAKEPLIDYVIENLDDPDEILKVASGPLEILFFTYFCFVAMEDTGVDLPLWSNEIYPEVLSQMAVLEYHLKAMEDSLVQYNGGYILGKILADTESIINGNEEKPKMYLYSGHEYNVALTLLTLKAFPPKVPNYGSYVVVEVHQINGTYGFMVFYQNYDETIPMQVEIPGCDKYFCPIDTFKALMETRLAPPDLSCD